MIERKGFDGPIDLTFTTSADVRISPVRVPAGADRAEAEAALSPAAHPGPRKVLIAASPCRLDDPVPLEVHVLPAGCAAAAGARVDREGTPYLSSIVRRIDKQAVVFLLVRPDKAEDRPFYVMRNKVWNGLFAAFARAEPQAVVGSLWHKGGQADGQDLGNSKERRTGLPGDPKRGRTLRPLAGRTSARCCTARSGCPPASAVRPWNHRSPGAARDRNSGRRRRPGPAGQRPGMDPRRAAGRGRNARRAARPVVCRRLGRRRAGSPGPETTPTQYPSHASPFTSFRVVIELPAR